MSSIKNRRLEFTARSKINNVIQIKLHILRLIVTFRPTFRHIQSSSAFQHCWRTKLQAGRSRVKFQKVSLEFCIDWVLPAALRGPGGDSASFKRYLLSGDGGIMNGVCA